MPFDRFFIGYTDSNASLETDLRPWLIPDNAFAQMDNLYAFRGRIRKRFGEILMDPNPLLSRFRVNIGTTDGAGNFSGTIPGTVIVGRIGLAFSVGAELFTVYQTGTPGVMLDTGAATVHTYNTTTGAVVINGAAINTIVYYYPTLPVMGLTLYQNGAINNEPSYGFDTQFAYVYIPGSGWQRSVLGTPPVWHGTDINFFWTCNWRGAFDDITTLFVTNFNAHVPAPAATDDPLWSFNSTAGWSTFVPYFAPAGGAPATGPFVATARLIVAFKDRLVLLNTIENDGGMGGGTNSAFVNRARFSHNGSPLSTNAWYEPNQKDSGGNIADGAGFIDATTEEQIVSAEFIKDRLIVYFERSTWELAYTGNQLLPFVWQKINTELGSESQMSTVPFDTEVLTIGNTGVHACNGANVQRVDNKIPDQIFQIIDKNLGVQRVAGIRDYFVEMVYWTFPSIEQNPNEKFPTKVLVYNYKNGAWSFNDDCITAFGYFEQQTDTTWANSLETWEEANFTWSSGVQQAQFRQIIAGNQQGWVFIIDPEISRNAPVMQISNISVVGNFTQLLIIDHTLNNGDFIAIENAQGVTGLNGNIYQVIFVDTNHVNLISAIFTGVYTGGGQATRISNLILKSKQWNPYVNQDRNVYLAKIDFAVQKTTDGEITVDYSPSSTNLSMINAAVSTNMIMGTGVLETFPYTLYPLEQEQERLWHPVYFQTSGECIQIYMTFSITQITNPDIAWSDFELEGLVLYCKPTSYRLE